MATYTGRLTAKMIEKAKKDGKDNLREDGRTIGGVRFFGNHDVYFDSENADMIRIKEFVKEGYLIITPENPKSRPVESEPAKEINDEINEITNEVTKQRGRPKVK
jgi:hypothetical protein